jgi:hypothetical protein
VELEDVAEDLVVLRVGLVDVEPEEGVAGEQFLHVLAVEMDLFSTAVVDDSAHVRRDATADHRKALSMCHRGARELTCQG